jgi:hypothetical protein
MRISRRSRLTAAVTAIAFAILVSVAASHVHVGADADRVCAVCAAFAGKLEGPTCKVVVPHPVLVAFREREVPEAASVPRSFSVVLPPSCGPPRVA